MQHGFWTRYSFITVAVAFDQHTLAAVAAAALLCRRSGKKLCLLHVVENDHMIPVAPLTEPQTSPLWDVRLAVEHNTRAVALQRLDEIASSIDQRIPVVKHVVVGKPREVIAAEAAALGSALLIVGLDFESARRLPAGFSTSLGLLANTSTPIMLLDGSHGNPLKEEHLRVLLADDLSEQTEAAAAYAFSLVSSGRAISTKDSLTHLHVSGLSREVIGPAILAAAATARTVAEPDDLAAKVYDYASAATKDRMKARSGLYLDYLENSGATYHAEVVEGRVEAEITKAVHTHQPHFLIFGQHHPYHTRPFFVGRVPYKAMLAAKVPVVVVPNA